MPFVQRGLLVLQPSQEGRLSFDADAENVFSGRLAGAGLSWLSFESDRYGRAHSDRGDYAMALSGASFNGPQYYLDPTSGVAENGLPRYNWDQAAVQLTRDNVGSGHAGWSFTLGAGVTVTYGFRSTQPGSMPDDTGGFSRFNAAQILAAEAALQAWADVANITFTRVGTGSTGEGAYTNNATILFSNYATGAEAAAAFAYYPWPSSTGAGSVEGDVWVNNSLPENMDLTLGTYGPHLLAHEIGHAIGISHPGDYNATPGVDITYPEFATYWQDSRAYTVMSYFGSAGVGHSLNGFAAGPQLHDIAAAQYLYGVNTTTRTGDTVYGFNSNTGRAHYTITAGQSPVFAIWDAGGNDTIDLSGFSTSSEIDLRQEAFSSAGPGNGGVGVAVGNIAIARGAVIENAIGGSGADTLIGNSAANRFTGNGSSDSMNGMGGIDTSVYNTTAAGSLWTRNVSGTWTVITGPFGTDTLTSVERLDFTDRDVVLDNAQQTFLGNGTSDLLWRNVNNGAVVYWDVTGATQNSATIAGGAGFEWTLEGIGDFSGDARDDLLFRNTNGFAYIWNNANSSTVVFAGLIPLEWELSGIGDFNFDGRDDFLWRNTNNGGFADWLMNGATPIGQSIIGAAPLAWGVAGIADFNGDGADDILLRHTDGTLANWTTNGVTQTSAAIVSVVPNEWQIVGLGDFDGDGRADILWRNVNNGGLSEWRMDGTTQLGAAIVGGAPLEWDVAKIGDYNGDGKDDILWRHDDGTVALWVMNGFSVTSATIVGVVPIEWGLI